MLELWRCYQCKKLHLNVLYLKRVPPTCDCGDNRVTKSFPSTFLEKLKVLWWELTIRG